MKRILLILFMLLSYSICPAQSYDKMWRAISDYQKKDLPQSVIKEANNIFIKAQKEKNSVQMIKSFLIAMQYREDISADSLKNDLAFLERWAQQTERKDERAVLYSILADRYSVSDVKKALRYVRLSLDDAQHLSTQNSSLYKQIMNSDKMSERYFNDNLLYLVAKSDIGVVERLGWRSSASRKILGTDINSIDSFEKCELIPRNETDYAYEYLRIYQTMLRQFSDKKMSNAWIVTAADAASFIPDYLKTEDNGFTDRNLYSIINRYAGHEAVSYSYLLLVRRKHGVNNVEALRLIRECLSKYPKCSVSEELKEIEKDIRRADCGMSLRSVFANVGTDMSVHYKNVPSFRIRLFRLNPSVTTMMVSNREYDTDELKKGMKLVDTKEYKLVEHNDYAYHDTTLTYKIEKPGIYYIEQEINKELKNGQILCATSMLPIIREIPGRKIEIIALDALNGKPVGNATFNTFTDKNGENELLGSYVIGESGRLVIDADKNINGYTVTTPQDMAMRVYNFRTYSYYSNTDSQRENMTLFTDRPLYKPGQTVHFTGMAYTQEGDLTRVIASKDYEVSLLDATYNVINKMHVTTDKFGAFNGSFILPSRCLNGRFSIRMASCSIMFAVEEYKRPAFQVEFKPIEGTFAIGDTITVSACATTYSGVHVAGAKVNYQIRNLYKSGIYRSGETKTDDEGCFSVRIPVEKTEGVHYRYWFDRYNLSATVVDESGETASADIVIPLGSSPISLNALGIDDRILKEVADSVECSATNLSGSKVDTTIRLRLFRLENEGKDSVMVVDMNVQSNKKIPMSFVNNLQSAKYRILLTASDEQSRECMYRKEFILFSRKDKRPPVNTDFWNYWSVKDNIISIGTSKKDVDMYVSIFTNDKIIEDKVINMTDGIVTIDAGYKSEYGDGALFVIAFVKDGAPQCVKYNVEKPFPEKHLDLKWETFRDKLHPGDNEEWKLKITHKNGKPANAQLMSTMYDASLDAIGGYYNRGWAFSVNYLRKRKYYNYSFNTGAYIYLAPNVRPSGRKFMGEPELMLRSNKVYMAAAPKIGKDAAVAESVVSDEKPVIRKDFSETAFFYPQLGADDNGEVRISFTLPESLTKWHFVGFAHTEDVDYGTIESEITVSKEFMVKPSLPRFLRTGDKCIIPVAVTNLKETGVKGNLTIEMIEPIKNTVVFSREQKFDVGSGETGNYQFEYKIPKDYTLLICRIAGKGKNFSDGEQDYIPVLSDKEMVTKSVPMIMTDNGKYNYRILSDKDKKVTLEITANPIWHVVQSLPIMLTPKDESAYSWATSLYASIINMYLLSKNPDLCQLSSIYNKTFPTDTNKDMLESELQKNQELKDIILSETPWIAEANNEEQQRKMLAEIGDVNQAGYTQKVAIEHLRDLQNVDGSWSWYKRMTGNINITTDIMEVMARTKYLTNTTFTSEMSRMYQSAFTYLKNQVQKTYQQFVKSEKEGHEVYDVPLWVIKYIYVSTLDRTLKADSKVNSYFVGKLKNNAPSLDIYEKGLCAVIFSKMNMRQDANMFLESLAQYTVCSKDMGRYFDTKKAKCTYASNIIPSVVSTIEAMQHSGYNKDYVEQMKQWLVFMKGMQGWSTNTATTNAIFALLGDGKVNQHSAGNGFVKIETGNESLKIGQNEPLGYIKRDIRNSVRNISVEKTYPGLSYGAVYVQGLQKVDELQESSTGLQIKKTLYHNGVEVDKNTVLKVGDVITVQLELKAPAYMDFIQIKDPLYSCMQPREQLSSVRWNNGVVYNMQIKNASVNFFIEKLGKGEHMIKYDVFVTKKGTFAPGVTRAESAYFPMMRSVALSSYLMVE